MMNKDLSATASGSQDGIVKVENLAYLDLKQEITIAQSMKSAMERE